MIALLLLRFIRFIARAAAVMLIVLTALPFLRTEEWWVRYGDFPRLQIALGGLVLILGTIWLWRQMPRGDRALGFLLAAAVAVQAWFIFPYTALAWKQVRSAADETDESALRLFTANVLMSNREAELLRAMIREHNPDIILLTETDAWWIEQFKAFEATHPFAVLRPQQNTYGMALYSRFELFEPEVLFRIEPDIPSIRAGVRLRNGRVIALHAVHPRPPGVDPPGARELQDSGPRDAELLLVAREIAARGGPAVIIGDFNDVAWSHTSRLFQRIGRLLDPRVGRGLYNTFDANHPLLRYPLDHVFHTDHFVLAELKRLPFFGSDHFPIFAALHFSPAVSQPSQVPTPKPGDAQEAVETIDKER